MVGGPIRRGQEEGNNVHRLAINGVEPHRGPARREDAHPTGHGGMSRVRDGQPIADPGGTQLFALENSIQDAREVGCG